MRTFLAVSGVQMAWVDRVSIAVRQTLERSDKLKAFTEGRIRRCVMMALPAGIGPNTILVSAGLPVPTHENIGPCLTVRLPIYVGVIWEQPAHFLEDTDSTAAAVFAEIQRELAANYYLKIPQFGNQRLTSSIVDFTPFGPPAYQDGENAVTLLQWLSCEYEADLSGPVWDVV